MASIIKKIKKGRPYYYAAESKRVDGKPRIVWQKYLGTIDAIVERAEKSKPAKPKETVIFEAGGVAALLRIAQRLRLIELIDEVVPKRDQGPSVGQYMILAALNRALAPCSKLKIGDWYEETVLRRLWRFAKSAFSSQRFWDHMGLLSQEAIETIQDRLVPHIEKEFGIDPRILLYDATNFFTFIATSNTRNSISQRGHSKAKRHDLKQVGLALLVTRDFQIPLFHNAYPGNVADVTVFSRLSGDLVARHKKAAAACREATLVFDKGNVSDNNMEELVVSGTRFVAALPLNRFPELAKIPLDQFEETSAFPATRAFTSQVELWGARCLGVVTYTESFFTQQLSGITQNLVQCRKKLMDLEKRLRRWQEGKGRGKKPSLRNVKKSVNRALGAQFMKELFDINVTEEKGLPRLQYALNHETLGRISNERLGRTLLVTNHLEWTGNDVIDAYRSLTAIENVFKNVKNVDYLRWQPSYHWTDQKLKVHAFYCVMAVLLANLARKIAVESGIDLSLHELISELTTIREVALIYPKGVLAHPKDHITLSRMSPRQRKLAECLQISDVLGG